MTTPWAHQQAAFDICSKRTATLLYLKPGGGKSKIACMLMDSWAPQRTLLLCPTTVRPVWRREIARHSARAVEAAILDRGSVARRTEDARLACDSRGPVVVVVNYEASWREPFYSWASSTEWDLMVCDESHRLMHKSRQSEAACVIGRRAARRLCLTGTPLTQDPLSVWAQCRFLNPAIFGDDLDKFVATYHNPHALAARKSLSRLQQSFARHGVALSPVPEEWLRGTLNTKDYLNRLAGVACQVEAKLDLPPVMIEHRSFQLSRRAREAYGAYDQGDSGPTSDHVSVMRLQQITSGFLPKEDGGYWHLGWGKLWLLRDLLLDLRGQPVVVFARFRFDLEQVRRLANHLGLKYGEISQRRKDGLTDRGEMAEGVQVCGVQPQAGGAGIDLTRASYAVVYSPSWSLAEYDQMLARVARPPASRSIVIYHLVAEDTIDQTIYQSLAARREIIRQVWDSLSRAGGSNAASLPADTADLVCSTSIGPCS